MSLPVFAKLSHMLNASPLSFLFSLSHSPPPQNKNQSYPNRERTEKRGKSVILLKRRNEDRGKGKKQSFPTLLFPLVSACSNWVNLISVKGGGGEIIYFDNWRYGFFRISTRKCVTVKLQTFVYWIKVFTYLFHIELFQCRLFTTPVGG